jgi:DNA-binding MarR family transcriptional regulator
MEIPVLAARTSCILRFSRIRPFASDIFENRIQFPWSNRLGKIPDHAGSQAAIWISQKVNAASPHLSFSYDFFPLDNDCCNDYIWGMGSRFRVAKPLQTLEGQIFVTLQKAADALSQQTEQLLKANHLTGAQYNVLRILRGAEPEGLACSDIGDRMISHDPDMTRLLDRMEKRALITRQRQKDDRRVVKTRITATGLELLRGLDQPIRELHKRQFQHMPAARLKTFADLLDQVVVCEAETKAS